MAGIDFFDFIKYTCLKTVKPSTALGCSVSEQMVEGFCFPFHHLNPTRFPSPIFFITRRLRLPQHRKSH
jgi:hypothetical protein